MPEPYLPDAMGELVEASAALRKTVVSDEQLPDVAGLTRKIESDLARFRRGLISEAMDHAEGRLYYIEDINTGVRSYSPWKIIVDMAEAINGTPLDAIKFLYNEDALRISFHWSNLQKAANAARMDLSIHSGEITDDDAEHHVGVYYKSERRVTAKPLKEDM